MAMLLLFIVLPILKSILFVILYIGITKPVYIVVQVDINQVDSSNSNHIVVVVLLLLLFIPALQFIHLVPSDGEHILDVIDVDVDEPIDNQYARPRITEKHERIGDNYDKYSKNEGA
jgi:hypothetical protein